jgi:hypothetical protein
MSIKEAIDHYEAGFRIFPLHQFNQDGTCGCGIDDCPTAGKHPKIGRWQNVPHWSEEQFNNMYEYSIEQGYGIICDNHIVLDVDKRNGGFESLAKLNKDLKMDFEKESEFVVTTGGGGLHVFFKAPEGVALVSHHKKYVGIDFKSGSGSYLVGCGSLHKSGAFYDRKKGFPQDIGDAPHSLIELLKKPERVRARVTDKEFIDISEQEIIDLLSFINPDCAYDDWISIGMGLHEATGGSGFHLWDDWSAKGSNYQTETMDSHWQSFGKCSNPITIGSVIHHARAGGWKQPIDLNLPDMEEHETDGLPFAIDSVDLLRPIGFVGDVTNWINSQCRHPREKLAVMSALNVVGNIGAMRYEDDYNGIEANTIFFGVAASGSGKDAVLKATSQLFRETGLAPAIHGGIKSEQEIVRNLVRNQAAYYMIDELGIQLKKIMNAGKSGASYLEAAIGTIMSVYTKADDAFLISGDVKDDIRNSLIKEAAQCQKKIHENEDEHGHYARRLKHLSDRAIPSVDNGLERPYLSVMGYTTPSTFDSLMGQDMAENGFMSRAFIVREHETNPKRKKGFKKAPLDRMITATLKTIYCGGVGCEMDRVEWSGDRLIVQTTKEAADMLESVADWFEDDGDRHKARTGLEALSRRGYEQVAKISHILAIPSRIRDHEHVRWAFAYVKNNYEDKVRLAQTNILSESNDIKDATTVLMNRILDICGGDDGEPISVIKQRCGKKYSPTDIADTVQEMINRKLMECIESQSKRGRKRERYRKI